MGEFELGSSGELGGLALVMGAGGIGAALAQALRESGVHRQVIALSRKSDPPVDVTDEDSIRGAAEHVKTLDGELRLVIDATGFLHDERYGPEKTWSQLDYDHMTKAFAVNAAGPALLLRFNGGDGLEVGDGSTVTRVRAILNGGDGMEVQSGVAGATIVNTVSFGNGASGLRLGSGSVVRSSNVYVNREDGVLMSDASTAIDSASRNNQGDGIDCGAGGAIKGNIIAGNLGSATRNCVETGTNFCDGDTVCP